MQRFWNAKLLKALTVHVFISSLIIFAPKKCRLKEELILNNAHLLNKAIDGFQHLDIPKSRMHYLQVAQEMWILTCPFEYLIYGKKFSTNRWKILSRFLFKIHRKHVSYALTSIGGRVSSNEFIDNKQSLPSTFIPHETLSTATSFSSLCWCKRTTELSPLCSWFHLFMHSNWLNTIKYHGKYKQEITSRM